MRKHPRKLQSKLESDEQKIVRSTGIVEDDIAAFKNIYHESGDLATREFWFHNKKGTVLYLEAMIDTDLLEQTFFIPLSEEKFDDRYSIEDLIVSTDWKKGSNLTKESTMLTRGFAAILLEGEPNIIYVSVGLFFDRSIDEPSNEKIVRGSHEGLIESLYVNLNILRRRAQSKELTVKKTKVGSKLQRETAILYMNDIADPEIVNTIKTRIDAIDSDLVVSPGFVGEYIQDNAYTPFPQILYTERPDRIISHLLEGRVVIIMDGSPTALIAPVSAFAFFQSPDDYNVHFILGSFYRLIRFLSLTLAVTLPALYISIVAFNYEILPNPLILPIKNSLANIPYPPLIEALIMEFTIELIREAGVRLPSPIGQTIGIVGGLVIGEAVVSAGLVSNMMIIVVALTAIASFVIPSPEMNSVVRVLRFPFMFLASIFGILGVTLASMLLLIHLCKLTSFGKPYLSPISPFDLKDTKDTIIRMPVWFLNTRPSSIHPQKLKQQGYSWWWRKNGKDK
ncbi:spore germination protein [Alkalicoccobacillus murimartini]|uniref:Spore germination protein KA n=1 Tax=Alkalicoccobacillus murimartini TaxID=171685 RepID=A0ABT9YJA0_9BACI|nr:spore germination protein [Alkalicoccobacillus murimartini]MDQ0207759.1 spore germination protein KA [Alkalicoccobacillus murimartini]